MDCNVGRAHGFGRIALTAQKLGYHLRELEAQMGMYDNMKYASSRYGNGGKLHQFQLATAVDDWQELDELALPF